MAYKSQLETIWTKLSKEGSIRRPITSRTEFNTVVAAFIQAEHCPHSVPSSPDVDAFRAEWNVWTYFCELYQDVSITCTLLFTTLKQVLSLDFKVQFIGHSAVRLALTRACW